ncbi:MAG: hypothetical protein E4G98_05025 [Promethearchaeota archaeon]|nr:MAG: hypothetical protein E4G98_05025 [Candidatus Lokiarchaeota archaeon]
MINGIQISDSNGIPFYTKFMQLEEEFDSTILSGLISAIGNISNVLFRKDVASISFGAGENAHEIIMISKELHQQSRKIYFVFFTQGGVDISYLRRMSTTLYIEAKDLLHLRTAEVNNVFHRIDNIITNQFAEIAQ